MTKMTKDQVRHVIAVLSGWLDGEIVQYHRDGPSPSMFNPLHLLYWPDRHRIKPKPREWWVKACGASALSIGDLANPPSFESFPGEIIRVREVI